MADQPWEYAAGLEERAKEWRAEMRRERERNRFASALYERHLLKKKYTWFSEERALEKKQRVAKEKLDRLQIEQEEKKRLAIALGLMYNLDLTMPAAERLTKLLFV